jgi:hypothetical protein
MNEISKTSLGSLYMRFIILLLGIGAGAMAFSVTSRTFPEVCQPFGRQHLGCLAENWIYKVGGPVPLVFLWSGFAILLICVGLKPSPRSQT